MDYLRVLRLHFVNRLSGRDIAANCGCGKTTVNEFIRRFNDCGELRYPLPEGVTNEYIEKLLYKKPGVQSDQSLFRDFDPEAVCKALSRKGETLKHQWQKYNAVGIIDGRKPMSYRLFCQRYAEWTEERKITFHIQRYPGIDMELDYAGKKLYIHDRHDPNSTTDVVIFIAALTYSDYFYAEGMTSCDIRNWIRVNNNALDYFGGVTQTVTPDNCKVAVIENKDWISPSLNKDFQSWAEHNNTVIAPAKVKAPRWKPIVEGHVKIVTMHILTEMDEMIFYSLEDLNRTLLRKVNEENEANFEGLNYSRLDLFNNEEKETLLPLPPCKFEYLERKIVKVAQDFSFTFDTVHYTMPRKYLKQELEIRAGENEIFVYDRHGDLIRTHQRSHTPKSWVVIPSDMPKEYGDYGYWNVPYFLQKASVIGPDTKALIEGVMKKFKYPVQSFRSCFGILKFAEKYSKPALEKCCHDALLAGKCNYTYIANTITTYAGAEENTVTPEQPPVSHPDTPVTGRFKDDDARYSLRNLLEKQKEGGAR